MIYDPRRFAQIRSATLVLGGLAWAVLLILPMFEPGSPAEHSHGHAAHQEIAFAGLLQEGWQLAVGNWLLMLVAMMAPVLAPAIYHVRVSSLARRRGRSTVLFIVGYTGVWIAAGAVLLSLLDVQRAIGLPQYGTAAALFAFALVWQFSPSKQTCLNRCHEQPSLAAFGWAADVDALRCGATHGTWCAGSCWAWMTLPLLLPHGHLPAMGLAALLIYCERLDGPQPQRWQLRGLGRATRLIVARSQTLF